MIKETWTTKIKEIGRKIEEMITFCLFLSISPWSEKLQNFAVISCRLYLHTSELPSTHIITAYNTCIPMLIFHPGKKKMIVAGCSIYFLNTFAQNSIIYCFLLPDPDGPVNLNSMFILVQIGVHFQIENSAFCTNMVACQWKTSYFSPISAGCKICWYAVLKFFTLRLEEIPVI